MNNILNFYQISKNVGTGGQPTVDQLSAIARAGYSTLINLAMHDSDNAIAQEGNIIAALGMSYIHLPVPFDAPSVSHVKKFFKLMDALGDENVFVHCAVNARVSAFMHQYLTLIQGLPSEQVTSPLLKQWLPTMDGQWQSIMRLTMDDINGSEKIE